MYQPACPPVQNPVPNVTTLSAVMTAPADVG